LLQTFPDKLYSRTNSAYLLDLKRSDVSTRMAGVRGGVDDEMTVETMAPRLNARTAPMKVKP
jgi:hypothetical protein